MVIYNAKQAKFIWIKDAEELEFKFADERDYIPFYKGEEVEIIEEDTREDDLQFALEIADRDVWQLALKYDFSQEDKRALSNIFAVLADLTREDYGK